MTKAQLKQMLLTRRANDVASALFTTDVAVRLR
ncbi:Uncharacterised protein [Corynebacterium minutissimum]|uniref:Uncharacterized protein n=1 Tax=Corynebacterium minutissimum TaxID=38301 RepID=A0A2X4RPS3_9CORY|nr:Uncharacterised protein [Corynebacterium minutissimum]VEG04556.1 Uncharacterised protein [Corynebacterium minutissimum]